MALAWLLRRWGDPLAVVVDHGLRAASAGEAAVTMERLAAMGIPARLVTLRVGPGPGSGARARAARYEALLGACREAGRPDLFIAHHRQDLAETKLLRAAAGSGAAGLAGMAAVSWRGDARLLRPLLPVPPARLRATLLQAGIGWVEDPGNTDPSTARGGLRARGVPDLAAEAAVRWARVRRVTEERTAAELAMHVTIHPTGHATVDGPLSARAWSALVWTVSGRAYPPRRAAVRQLMAAGCGTLHGVVVGRGLVAREAAAMAGTVPAARGAVWDGRFSVRFAPPGGAIGGAGTVLETGTRRLRRRRGLPSVVATVLPALSFGTDLLVIPHLAYPNAETCLTVGVDFRPPRPLAGAPFGLA
jgi:tRNA(Ile)-lysidine synthase